MVDEKTIYNIVEKAKKYDDLSFMNIQKEVVCSFCGKSQSAVKMIIMGAGVSICDECVEVCIEIIEENTSNDEENSK